MTRTVSRNLVRDCSVIVCLISENVTATASHSHSMLVAARLLPSVRMTISEERMCAPQRNQTVMSSLSKRSRSRETRDFHQQNPAAAASVNEVSHSVSPSAVPSVGIIQRARSSPHTIAAARSVTRSIDVSAISGCRELRALLDGRFRDDRFDFAIRIF